MTDEQLGLAQQLWLAGYGTWDIAHAIGLGEDAVYNRLHLIKAGQQNARSGVGSGRLTVGSPGVREGV